MGTAEALLIALEAQDRTITPVEFLIARTKLLDQLRGHINERQQKALLRIFREGSDGFKGGLTAGNYSRQTPEPLPRQSPAIQRASQKRAHLSARLSASTLAMR